MKPYLLAGGLLLASPLAASAATILNSGATFDFTATNWSNGAPASGNDGTIASAYTIGGNIGAPANTTVTQTAGAGTGGQFNYFNSSTYTFNLQGGSITSTGAGTSFFVNQGITNISGGTLSAVNIQLANTGRLTISGGTVATSNASTLFSSNGSGTNVVTLSGGTTTGSAATTFLPLTTVAATVGGSAVVTAPTVTGFFPAGTATSTLNFLSTWTGSLTFSAATDYRTLLQTSGATLNGVDIDASNINQFRVVGGTISIPEPSSAALLGVAALGLLRRARRSRR